MGARETALNVLIACRKEEGWSNGVLKSAIRKDGLDRREAALASRLCYGVIQNRLYLDHYLQQLLTGKLKDLHPAVRDILHLGLYQMLLMDKIPDSAAVNESVALAKKYCKKIRNAPGLVNAVLRNAQRSRDQLKAPDTWQTLYSHPQVLIDLLKSYVGKERIQGLLRADNDIAPTVLQVNTLKTTPQALAAMLEAQGISVAPHSWMTDCLTVTGSGNLEACDAFREGLCYVQDPAARLSVLCAQLPKDRDIRLLDCCSAPGGKSFAAAIAMEGRGQITSCDIHPHKIALIENGAQRLGLTNISARVCDASVPVDQWKDHFHAVIADVPCSGYGIIRKKPDIRYKDPASMVALPQLQLQILRNQAEYVMPGGLLMYSTCTLVQAENEDVVTAFLKEREDFSLEPLPLPSAFPENATGMLALVPGEYDTDGFFIARLRRKQ